jgi:hypothetical protein
MREVEPRVSKADASKSALFWHSTIRRSGLCRRAFKLISGYAG